MSARRFGRVIALATLAACAALTLPGCGYALAGRGNFLPDYIKIIGVPMFLNRSTVPDLDVKLTEAIRTEFQGHGHYKIVPEAEGADGVLTGTINAVTPRGIAFNDARQITRIAVTVSASVEFRDVKLDKVTWSNRAMQFTEEYDVSTSSNPNDATSFFGQDQTALERLAKNFAQSVVIAIVEAF